MGFIHFNRDTYRSVRVFVFMLLAVVNSNIWAKDSILFIRPLGKNYIKIEKEIRKKVQSDFDIQVLVANKYLNASDITQKLYQSLPKVILVIDYQALSIYQKYLKQSGAASIVYPSIILLPEAPNNVGLNVQKSITIKYGTSISDAVNEMERKLKRNFTTIGVVYRPPMKERLKKNIAFSKETNLSIKNYAISGPVRAVKNELSKKLNILFNNDKVDLLWVSNNPILTTSDMVKSVWIPFVRTTGVMTIVPRSSLVTGQNSFGALCIIPNYTEIGKQVGDLLLNLKNNKYSTKGLSIINGNAFIPIFGSIPANLPSNQSVELSSAFENARVQQPEPQPEKMPVEDESMTSTKVLDPSDIAQSLKKKKAVSDKKRSQNKSFNAKTKRNKIASRTKKNKKLEQESVIEKTDNIESDSTTSVKRGQDASVAVNNKTTIETESGNSVTVIEFQTSIFQNMEKDSKKLGVAKQGDQYPLISKNGTWYKIQYFTDTGWIQAVDVNIVKNPPAPSFLTFVEKYREYYRVIGVGSVVFLCLLIIIFIILKLKKSRIRVPTGKSCLVIARKFERISYSSKNEFTLPIHKYFKKIGFDIVVTKDLQKAKQILLHYIPTVICVDWQFELNVRSSLQQMLSEMSMLSNIFLIFYNTIDSFHIKKETKFASTFYLNTNFTLKDIGDILSVLSSGKKEVQLDGDKDNYLSGKITNYNLVEIFQLLGTEKKLGCLIIETDVPVGMVFFKNSKIIYAISNEATGKEAVFTILKLKAGLFRFLPDKVPIKTNMNDDIVQIIMEWSAEMDTNSLLDSDKGENEP